MEKESEKTFAEAISLVSGEFFGSAEEWQRFLVKVDDLLVNAFLQNCCGLGLVPTHEEAEVIAALKHLRRTADDEVTAE